MNTHPRDILNLLSKLSFRRLTNAGSVVASYYWSRISGKALHPALPISISIEPTTSCNLRCPECPSGLRSFTRPTGMLQPEFFRKVIDEVNDRVLYLTFYFQGEPFLNPAFLDMVNYAAGKKMYTATSTNAHYLDDEMAKRTVESGLDRLIISIDGTTQETYEQYRIGGKLEKVLEGTRNIVKWKKQLNKSTPYLVFQFLVVKPNEHQTEEVKKLAKEMGVDDVAFKTAQVYDYENGNALIPDNGKYSRYRQQSDGTYTIKNKLLNHCWKLWHSCVITWDGNIVPCCFDKDAGHKMGNLETKSFREIWNNESYQLFRNSLMKSRKEIDICKNCSEGTRVWAE
ncbi:MAG: SPASM domain-containing protein [Bacteroidetes bacterium]|nr:SPASM domain-containing protein [Bacteroidota bacterium]